MAAQTRQTKKTTRSRARARVVGQLTARRGGDPGGAGGGSRGSGELGSVRRGEALCRVRERWGGALTLGPWSGGVASAGRRGEHDETGRWVGGDDEHEKS